MNDCHTRFSVKRLVPANDVSRLRLRTAVATSVTIKLEAAEVALARGDTNTAIAKLTEVVRQLTAHVAFETPVLDEEIRNLSIATRLRRQP